MLPLQIFASTPVVLPASTASSTPIETSINALPITSTSTSIEISPATTATTFSSTPINALVNTTPSVTSSSPSTLPINKFYRQRIEPPDVNLIPINQDSNIDNVNNQNAKNTINNLFINSNGWPVGSQVGPQVRSQLGPQTGPQVGQQGNFMTSAPQLIQANDRPLTSTYAPSAPSTKDPGNTHPYTYLGLQDNFLYNSNGAVVPNPSGSGPSQPCSGPPPPSPPPPSGPPGPQDDKPHIPGRQGNGIPFHNTRRQATFPLHIMLIFRISTVALIRILRQ